MPVVRVSLMIAGPVPAIVKLGRNIPRIVSDHRCGDFNAHVLVGGVENRGECPTGNADHAVTEIDESFTPTITTRNATTDDVVSGLAVVVDTGLIVGAVLVAWSVVVPTLAILDDRVRHTDIKIESSTIFVSR